MSKKNFKKGDLVEYDFGYGIVIEVQTQPDHDDRGNPTALCKVLWSDGATEFIPMWRLNDPGPWLKRARVARYNKK